jgi:7,8-dihydro-6-hydroxymethylpterin-pyrophosphokinase
MEVYLGLGSNLGDRLGTLQAAADLLAADPGIAVRRTSRVSRLCPLVIFLFCS